MLEGVVVVSCVGESSIVVVEESGVVELEREGCAGHWEQRDEALHFDVRAERKEPKVRLVIRAGKNAQQREFERVESVDRVATLR